nr:hypothetical protein [Tanacetum cinerariifolium]
MNYIHTTDVELRINLDIPLREQDPLDKLNDLANKKKKHADEIHDYLKASCPLKVSSQLEGEHIKKDKAKKAISFGEAEKESTNIDHNDKTYVTGSMVEISRIKKAKKIDFFTKDETHIHLTKEQINQHKKIDEKAKPEAAKCESEVRKEELVDLPGPEVVNKYYNDKL